MGDHLVLCVDRLITPESLQSMQEAEAAGSFGECSSQVAEPHACAIDVKEVEEHSSCDEEEPLIQTVECRICQEEDIIKNLETPCSCSGSLKNTSKYFCLNYDMVSLACLHILVVLTNRDILPRHLPLSQRMLQLISGKSHKCALSYPEDRHDKDQCCSNFARFFLPGFVINVGLVTAVETLIFLRAFPVCEDLSMSKLFGSLEGWTISGATLDLRDPRILAMAAAERHLLEADYDEYAENNASGAAFCRSAALILMALLLLRHALYLTNGDGDDDASTYFSLFLLRAAGFLLPCYIMAWAISILQRRRQRQEAAALAATEVAFMIQEGQRRGVQVSIAPGPAVTPHQEPLQ
ncbi:hypothetical protein CRYUN_Cryun07bG0044500 [Craigia yunnanensis]